MAVFAKQHRAIEKLRGRMEVYIADVRSIPDGATRNEVVDLVALDVDVLLLLSHQLYDKLEAAEAAAAHAPWKASYEQLMVSYRDLAAQNKELRYVLRVIATFPKPLNNHGAALAQCSFLKKTAREVLIPSSEKAETPA